MTRAQIVTGVAVVAAVAVAGLFFFIGNPFSVSMSQSSQSPTQQNSLVVQDEAVGTGAEAKPGDTLTVNYTGKLQNGTVFDTSVGRAPFQFKLGAGQVIQGWEQGLAGMKVGGKRLLIIPSSLGYGSQGMGPIPADATLIFEVDLLGVAQGQ
jgi:peptidylprolyl isomerase/FKBP-type peptidyl-prolyl cis-trans isomerase FkpA